MEFKELIENLIYNSSFDMYPLYWTTDKKGIIKQKTGLEKKTCFSLTKRENH